jgi:hypothetical protein
MVKEWLLPPKTPPNTTKEKQVLPSEFFAAVSCGRGAKQLFQRAMGIDVVVLLGPTRRLSGLGLLSMACLR